MIGTRLGHYTLESCIGKGGMGEVYRAVDGRLGRSVAIKVLPLASAGREQSLRRFIQEAKTASSLNHPNIVTIHEIGDDDAVPFIVMEHIDGEPLSQVIDGPMALDRFFALALQITSALGAAHRAGIVHRDIKPGNIMVTASGMIKVVDFGLARLAANAPSEADVPPDASTETRVDTPLTMPGSIIGTVGYMSPEQVEGRPVDSRSDVFSVGVVLHEMLTGSPAFRASSVMGTLSAILRDEPPSLASARRDTPPALTALVRRCLAKKPEDRYANADEVHTGLLAIRESLHPAGRPSLLRRPATAALIAAALVLLVAFGVYWWRRDARSRWVRNEALPEIERLVLAQDTNAAYSLARRAMEISPDDPQLKQVWRRLNFYTTLESEPPGAQVEYRVYSARDASWTSLGTTPIAEVGVPLSHLRFRVTRDGHGPIEVAPQIAQTMRFELHRTGVVPPRMVAVSGGQTRFHGRTVQVPAFQIDQFEVTNREYRKFVEEGGYRRQEFWKHPIVRQGRTLAWAAAMREFSDSTGQPGPAGWELGSYAEGEDELPVEGVSWYEAAAYAEFAGKQLPTVYHWTRAATDFGVFSDVLTASNFGSKGPVAVGTMQGLGPHGTYDMAGNVKEWCSNSIGDLRFALGGAWFEPTYQFLTPDALAPIERKRGFGFRLMKESAPHPELNAEVVATPAVIPSPVDDATFGLYSRLFDYDPLPLDPKVEETDDSHPSWRREKVSIAAAYGDERIPAHLFLPLNARPPYQVVVFFPGSNARTMKSSANPWMHMLDFYVKSGRAVIYPVYKGTYERGVEASGPNAFRELRIQRVKDVRRVVDYVATRPDLDSGRLVYYGLSWGVVEGTYVLAVEPRFRTAVFVAGGFHQSSLPEFAMQNYLPQVRIPVLLVTGRYDFTQPYETSQKPFFELLGTPAEDKRHVVLEGGHLPPQYSEMVKEILGWTDARLGPVRR
jgi:serine/threonine protein kinase/formylglycine-generating enzyme required for sulfatase activity/dienelactone hydrolase